MSSKAEKNRCNVGVFAALPQAETLKAEVDIHKSLAVRLSVKHLVMSALLNGHGNSSAMQ